MTVKLRKSARLPDSEKRDRKLACVYVCIINAKVMQNLYIDTRPTDKRRARELDIFFSLERGHVVKRMLKWFETKIRIFITVRP